VTRPGRWPAPFVLLTGGKGGVGKTMAAANLGVHLARAGRRVLLVDLDLGLANLNVVLRLSPRFTVEDALAGRCRFADCVIEGPGGVHVLPAGSGTAAMGRDDEGRLRRLLAGITELAAGYELLIGDSAAGIGPDVLAAASAADLVVLVTTPDPAALTDAYGLVKALHTHAEASGFEVPTPELLVNLADGPDQAQAVAAKLRAVCERFLARSPRLAGWLPRASAIQSACREQRPIPSRDRNSLVQHCLRQISERIERCSKAPSAPGAALLKG
jgi:flagellar biosynthesis protein FlhG